MMNKIVADIGGTHARFAVVGPGDGLQQIKVLQCTKFATPLEAIRHYMDVSSLDRVDRICLAVAAIVQSEEIVLLNNHWRFNRTVLQAELGIPVKVINDFTAQALALQRFSGDELSWIGEARPLGGGIRVVMGAGTGLGVAALMPNGDIVPSEGGHVAFAPVDQHQLELLQVLWQRYQRVSAERLLSGPGLENLYWANARLQGEERRLAASNITAGAASGDELCLKAIVDFQDILAALAGDLAIAFWAQDGIYLSGGMLPHLTPLLDWLRFRYRFEEKGRLKAFTASVPVALVEAEFPGLIGCSVALKECE